MKSNRTINPDDQLTQEEWINKYSPETAQKSRMIRQDKIDKFNDEMINLNFEEKLSALFIVLACLSGLAMWFGLICFIFN